MIKYLASLAVLVFLFSCNGSTTESARDALAEDKIQDTTIHIVWREMKPDTTSFGIDTTSRIVINDQYCRQAQDAVKAAIGLTGTFIGTECQWDGEANDSMTNLSCKLFSALGLGYQCSEKHLSFLKHWFRNEPEILKQLEDCPVVPFTASSQNTFDKMDLQIKKDTLITRFEANGVNMRMEQYWEYSGTYIFKINGTRLILISNEESKPKYSSIKT